MIKNQVNIEYSLLLSEHFKHYPKLKVEVCRLEDDWQKKRELRL